MKQFILLFLATIVFAAAGAAQDNGATPAASADPSKQEELTPEQRKKRLALDLMIPEMKDPKDAGRGVRWSLIHRSKKKRRRLKRGDRLAIHITVYDQKTRKELMTTRRREGKPSGFASLDVGCSVMCLDLVLPQCQVGDKIRVDAPSNMAFGESGVPRIPPNTDVIYLIHIHEIKEHIDIPEIVAWDQELSRKMKCGHEYYVLKAGKGPMIGDLGIVVFDYMTFTDDGQVVDFSKLREYAMLGGQAAQMRSEYLSEIAPLAREGSEFMIRLDFKDIPARRKPFGLRGQRYLNMRLFTRWTIPFNNATEGMKTTKSGLQYEIVREGDGPPVKDSHHVTMHYAWWTVDGHHVESSYARGTTNTLRQKTLPPGMVEAIHLIRPGGKIRVRVPAALGFGARGRQGVPANTDMIMLVEVLGSKQLDPLPEQKGKKAEKKKSEPEGGKKEKK